MFKRILVPLDGSEVAEGVLPFVTALAKGSDATVTLLTVVDTSAMEEIEARVKVEPTMEFGSLLASKPTERPSVGVYRTQVEETAQEEAKIALRVIATRLTDLGLETRVAASAGPAAEEILRAAREEDIDLIAMSTHGRNALGRAILGSVTDKVLHSSSVPTLVITPERAKTYWGDGVVLSKILVPLDGSELAEEALPHVEDLARSLSLDVILARVVGLAMTPYVSYPYVGSEYLDVDITGAAVDYLKEVATRLKANGFNASWKLLRGATARAIVELARETPQDIIALTTHGRSGLSRWVLGSVAEALVRASGDPVLVIPAKD